VPAGPLSPASRRSQAAAATVAVGVLDAAAHLSLELVHVAVCESVEWVCDRVEEQADTPSLTMDDFTLLRLVGKGGYGKVFQVRCELNGLVYAMKVVDKASIERYRSMDNIAIELSILRTHAESRHPFILGLECAFQSPSKLHFVMEYVPGGMLFVHLRALEMFSEKMARFYAAEVLLGLQHLHSIRILYRDLKPENVLICQDGNCKLCDFGLAAIGLTASATHISSSGKAMLVGTTEYMAPEVLRRLPCGQGADVWSLGVLLYEMMTGEAPWWHKDQKELQRKIAHTKLKMPNWFTNEAKAVVRGLLTKDPTTRLGCVPGSPTNASDLSGLRAHPFFRSLNWRMLLARRLEPPFAPTVNTDDPTLDVSNFDSKYTAELPLLSPLRKPLSAGIEQQFEALSLEYISPEVRSSARASRISLVSIDSSGSLSRDSLLEPEPDDSGLLRFQSNSRLLR
jgi:serine/threonine protein kinase